MNPVLRVADALESRIRRAWMKALALATGKHVSETAIAQGLATGTPARGLAAIDWMAFDASLTIALTPILLQSLHDSALATIRQIPKKVRKAHGGDASFSFDVTNPRAVAWAHRHAGELVQQVSHESQEAIRRLVLQMFEQGITVAEQARRIRSYIGLTDRMVQAAERLRQTLTDQELDPSIVASRVASYRTRALAQRATTIARTEAMTASNQGQQELWKQAHEAGYLDTFTTRREWLVTPDERLCPICAPVPKDGPVGLDQPFTLGDGSMIMRPPAHPNCRCTMALVFDQ